MTKQPIHHLPGQGWRIDKKEQERCFIFHPYGRWTDHTKIGITKGSGKVGEILVQVRTCPKCGKTQYRQETIWKIDD